jgi:hypothetical protein
MNTQSTLKIQFSAKHFYLPMGFSIKKKAGLSKIETFRCYRFKTLFVISS